MKRTVSLLLAVVMLALGTVSVGAGSMKPGTSTARDIKIALKKADPDKVEKDGVISEGEYERYFADTTLATTPLVLVWTGNRYASAENMLSTMEYYFSWDEVHGFNFAVRYKPDDLVQQIKVKKGPIPEDGFMNNCAIGLCMNQKLRNSENEREYFYYCIGKSTVDGSYLVGHWDQKGLLRKYKPTGGRDFEVSYEDDGHVVFEWSVPFNEVLSSTDKLVGKHVYFTISAMSGNSKTDDFSSCYGVAFGEGGYLVTSVPENTHATAEITNVKVGEIFSDVSAKDYYYDSVKWALSSGITNGTSASEFSPKESCTRGQIVTFLHRAEGKPTVAKVNIFKDIKNDDYFYNAVLWAAMNGITNGTTPTTFSPKKTCTRAEAVTFLYRTFNSPETDGKVKFTDVKAGSYYADAVAWAVENGIVKGMTETTFEPDGVCTRGQIVTLLCRAYKR